MSARSKQGRTSGSSYSMKSIKAESGLDLGSPFIQVTKELNFYGD